MLRLLQKPNRTNNWKIQCTVNDNHSIKESDHRCVNRDSRKQLGFQSLGPGEVCALWPLGGTVGIAFSSYTGAQWGFFIQRNLGLGAGPGAHKWGLSKCVFSSLAECLVQVLPLTTLPRGKADLHPPRSGCELSSSTRAQGGAGQSLEGHTFAWTAPPLAEALGSPTQLLELRGYAPHGLGSAPPYASLSLYR